MTSNTPTRGSVCPPRRWVLWTVICATAWMVHLIGRAYGELTDIRPIKGLFRIYEAPYLSAFGWVVDPRKNTIEAELERRYGFRETTPKPQRGEIAWCDFLRAGGLNCTAHSAPDNELSVVRLRIFGDGRPPQLWLGRLGIEHVLFIPDLGVVVTPTLLPAQTVLILSDARESPW